MAISIKTIPVLTGESADRFVCEAEKNSSNIRPVVSEEVKDAIANMLEASRNFKFKVQRVSIQNCCIDYIG